MKMHVIDIRYALSTIFFNTIHDISKFHHCSPNRQRTLQD